ncbi:MAG: glycosyltransferase [Dysgonamonadaceae bacterium]|nr:glycosyltransferase [Dysgonamonadaceae bacterium]
MKLLFTVQGEGRGHYTQALSLANMLRKNGHTVAAVLVGKSSSREIPAFFSEKINAPLFDFNSPNFTSFYKQKRPNIVISVLHNFSRPIIFSKSMRFVKRKIEEYKPDMVINFYEMITGMTFGYYRLGKKLGVKLICIGHQYILLNDSFSTSKEQDVKYYFLRVLTKWTSLGASKILALSFRDMPGCEGRNLAVLPPLLRPDIFTVEARKGDYIHGYMLNTGYFEEIQDWHTKNPRIPLRFFWDKKDADDITRIDDNFTLYRLNDKLFIESMAGCIAYSTTSGFESICEAMYFQKPILMIPVHVEQEFNAFDAGLAGAGISSKKFKLNKLLNFIPHYMPDTNFRGWVLGAEEKFMKEINAVYENKPPAKTIGFDIFVKPK